MVELSTDLIVKRIGCSLSTSLNTKTKLEFIMSNDNFMITEESVQGANTAAMALLSLAEHYDLPEAVNLMIEELNDRTGALVTRYHVENSGDTLKVVNS
jgi:hypothetical protein